MGKALASSSIGNHSANLSFRGVCEVETTSVVRMCLYQNGGEGIMSLLRLWFCQMSFSVRWFTDEDLDFRGAETHSLISCVHLCACGWVNVKCCESEVVYASRYFLFKTSSLPVAILYSIGKLFRLRYTKKRMDE
eukprot:gene7862-5489_t